MEQEIINMDKVKTITVLLSRQYDTFSKLVYYVTGRGYTHASLSLDEDEECYYSFNIKGFRRERPSRWKKQGEKIAYRMLIPESEYDVIYDEVKRMEAHSESLSYSSIGVFFCLLHIPFKMKNKYFCSQFVTEMLQKTSSIQLKKKSYLYVPNELPEILSEQKCLKEIIFQAT